MSFKYSAHPVLAAEQLRAENDAIAKNLTQTPTTTTGTASGMSSSLSKAMLTQHRRHKSASGMLATQKTHSGTNNCDTTTTTTRRSSSPSIKAKTPNSSLKRSGTTPQATPEASPAMLGATTTTNTIHHPTKDCHDTTDSATNSNSNSTPHVPFNASVSCHAVALTAANLTPSVQLQQRLMRSSSSSRSPCHQQQHIEAVDSSGCSTATSSAFSSPTPSTDSTPLSSPTRLPQQLHHVHQHCCQKAHHCGSSQLKPAAHYQLHHHHHHQQHQHQHSSSSATAATAGATDCVDVVNGGGGDATAAGCKKWQQKFDPRLGPSPYRQLLPIALCILSFAAVFATLIVYMDTTEIRHQQFRLEMSRDYVFYGVAQDDPNLINFLRQNHMRKYPKHFLKNHVDSNGSSSSSSMSSSSIKSGALPSTAHSHDVVDQHWNSTHGELAPAMANYVAELLGNKRNGAVLQSMTGAAGKLITGLWLAETLNWMAILVEPEPRRYFSLSKQSAQLEDGQTQVIQACVSPIQYPKEITMHYEDMDVRINSLHEEESSWFNSRVKCFALYSIMLAVERTQYDLLSLGVHGHELEILQTLPFEKVQIELISIHLNDDNSITNAYIQAISSFLESKSFKLQRSFGRNYFYQRIVTASSRTRKKDVLLLKTP